MHIYVLVSKPVQWIFKKKSLSYHYEVVHTNFFADFFGVFEIFDRNFAKIVSPPDSRNENYVMLPKERSSSKKEDGNCTEIDQ